MKDKLRSKSFWMSLIGALLVFLQTLGFTFNIPAVSEAVSAGLAILVVTGIISADDNNKTGGETPKGDGEDNAEGAVKQTAEESSSLNESDANGEQSPVAV